MNKSKSRTENKVKGSDRSVRSTRAMSKSSTGNAKAAGEGARSTRASSLTSLSG